MIESGIFFFSSNFSRPIALLRNINEHIMLKPKALLLKISSLKLTEVFAVSFTC